MTGDEGSTTNEHKQAADEQESSSVRRSSFVVRRSSFVFDVPWTLRDVLLAIAVVGGLAALTGGIVLGLGLLYGGRFLQDRQLAIIAVAGLFLEGALLGAAWLFGVRRHRGKLGQLGFRHFDPFEAFGFIWMTVIAGLLVNVIYLVVIEALGLEFLRPPSPTRQFGQGLWAMAVAFALAGLFAPIAEETFFRGFMLPALGKAVGGFWGLLASAAIFGLAHFQFRGLVPIFLLGVLLGWLRLRTGSIWPGVIVHAIYNSFALAAGFAHVEGG